MLPWWAWQHVKSPRPACRIQWTTAHSSTATIPEIWDKNHSTSLHYTNLLVIYFMGYSMPLQYRIAWHTFFDIDNRHSWQNATTRKYKAEGINSMWMFSCVDSLTHITAQCTKASVNFIQNVVNPSNPLITSLALLTNISSQLICVLHSTSSDRLSRRHHAPSRRPHGPIVRWCRTSFRCTARPQWTGDIECLVPCAREKRRSDSRDRQPHTPVEPALYLTNHTTGTCPLTYLQ